jgi:hypothetical protein
MPSYYPLLSFVLCFVCASWNYVFLLPLGIFCPLFCPSFIDLHLLIIPLVSFFHCFVCPSLIYDFWLLFGIFCPLFCLSFIDLRLLIIPWYLLSIVFSVLHWFTPSYYPLASFVHKNQQRTNKIMDKRYQAVIRRRESMKERKNNGQKIPWGNKKA